MYSCEKPFITVIMCNYNYGRFIGEAIESVLSQTYGHFELIIIDDGSTDNSLKIVSEFEDPRIQVISQPNGGQASAFNTGFRVAKGDIVSFIDSDDWWKPHKLQSLVEWHNLLRGSYSVLQHNLAVWQDGIIRPYKLYLPSGDCFAAMMRSNEFDFFVPTSGLSFPKPILDKVFPIPLEFRLAADAYLMRTAFVFGPVISIPEELGYYRKHTTARVGNNHYDHVRFFNTVIFPSLNTFYREQGLEYAHPGLLPPRRTGIRILDGLLSAAGRRFKAWFHG